MWLRLELHVVVPDVQDMVAELSNTTIQHQSISTGKEMSSMKI
jgi:hypothetical protein